MITTPDGKELYMNTQGLTQWDRPQPLINVCPDVLPPSIHYQIVSTSSNGYKFIYKDRTYYFSDDMNKTIKNKIQESQATLTQNDRWYSFKFEKDSIVYTFTMTVSKQDTVKFILQSENGKPPCEITGIISKI